MDTYGLIGQSLSHSFSCKYFEEKFSRLQLKDKSYKNFEIKNVEEIKQLLIEDRSIKGFNVTTPFKESITSLLDKLDPVAQRIGAVNTVVVKRDGLSDKIYLEGYNTDADAFREALAPIIRPHHRRALILGTGGASKAVSYALTKNNMEHFFVTRHPSKFHYCYADLNHNAMRLFQVIINTTPLGTYPNVNDCAPIPYEMLTNKHLLFDLVYNPAQTKFLQLGKDKGAFIHNGFRMLKLQADRSWEIWNNQH